MISFDSDPLVKRAAFSVMDDIDKQILTCAIIQEHRQRWEQDCDDDKQDFIHY